MAVEKLSRTLDRLLSDAGLPAVAVQVAIVRSWKRIAGPILAGKTAPSRFRHGILTVNVPNASWAQELQLAKPVLLGKIGTILGKEAVRDIRFRVGPISSPGGEILHERGEAEQVRLPPLVSPDEIEEIRNPELRDLLRSILEKSPRRKK